MLIAKGKYRAFCVNAQLGYTAKETEQVALSFVIVDDDSPHRGESITWYGYFTEKTMASTVKALRACGWQGDDLSILDSCVDGSGGQEVEIDVEHEQDQKGEMRARVRWVNVPGQGGLKNPMDGQQASAFAARMKAQIARVKSESAKARSPAAQPAAAQHPPQTYSRPNPLPDGVATPENANQFDIDTPF